MGHKELIGEPNKINQLSIEDDGCPDIFQQINIHIPSQFVIEEQLKYNVTSKDFLYNQTFGVLGFFTFFFSFLTSSSFSSCCCSGLLICVGLSADLFSCSCICFTTEGELVPPVTAATCCGRTAVGTVQSR